MRKTSIELQEPRRKIYSKAKTDSVGSGGVGGDFRYEISTGKQLQADRCIGFVAKRTGKPYEGKPHVRFEAAGDGEVLRRT